MQPASLAPIEYYQVSQRVGEALEWLERAELSVL
jgi:hypothetical protein